MTKRQFKPDVWKRKTRQKEKKKRETMRLQMERTGFEIQANRPYRIADGFWLRIKPGEETQCFIVYLKKPLSFGEIRERVEKGFGDLQ